VSECQEYQIATELGREPSMSAFGCDFNRSTHRFIFMAKRWSV